MKSKEILIISCYDIIDSNSAGEHRVRLYIKALLLHNEIEKISLYYKGKLWLFYKDWRVEVQKKSFWKMYESLDKKTRVLVYPSTNVLLDIFYLLYFKTVTSNKIYIELNEVRKYSVTLIEKNKSLIKSLKNRVKIFLSNIQDFFVRYYDGVITISDNISLYYSKKNNNICQIPILSEIPDKINYPVNYKDHTPFIILFTGTVNIIKENIDVLIKSIDTLNCKYIHLHLYGKVDNYNLSQLTELVKKYNLEGQVFYKGVVPQNQLTELYKQANLLILPRGNIKQNQYGFSTKLSEYLVSGRPVLVTNVSDNGKYIFDNQNGFIVEPDSVEALISKIRYIYENYNSINNIIPPNAYQAAKDNFDYRLYSNDLAKFLLW